MTDPRVEPEPGPPDTPGPRRPLPDNAIEVIDSLDLDQLVALGDDWRARLPDSQEREVALSNLSRLTNLRRQGRLGDRRHVVPQTVRTVREAYKKALDNPTPRVLPL